MPTHVNSYRIHSRMLTDFKRNLPCDWQNGLPMNNKWIRCSIDLMLEINNNNLRFWNFAYLHWNSIRSYFTVQKLPVSYVTYDIPSVAKYTNANRELTGLRSFKWYCVCVCITTLVWCNFWICMYRILIIALACVTMRKQKTVRQEDEIFAKCH